MIKFSRGYLKTLEMQERINQTDKAVEKNDR